MKGWLFAIIVGAALVCLMFAGALEAVKRMAG